MCMFAKLLRLDCGAHSREVPDGLAAAVLTRGRESRADLQLPRGKICVHVHVCACVHMCACVCMCVHVCGGFFLHVPVWRVCIYVCMYACKYA